MAKQLTAEDTQNDALIEAQWAEKAFKYAEAFERLQAALPAGTPVSGGGSTAAAPPACAALTRARNTRTDQLRLGPHDDKVYESFRAEFSREALPVAQLNEDELKRNADKPKWRKWMEQYKDVVVDYNMGTLLKADSAKEFGPDNCILVPRVQFMAIELARSREL